MQTQKSPRLLAAAVILFGIGMVAALALLLPVVRDSNTAIVTTLYLLALCAPLGFVLGLVFALLSGRRSR
ncbi:hypothetical protein [Gordonia humi]|uniref:Putative membrane protein n=1 Tax=Gordonia humi TaxID=686429 RepID=A0A840EXF3_9ACTN|nr:hypothetical protein [Gordonia humi]MBB4135028.1 putative membrane protein [Gordonia humi]